MRKAVLAAIAACVLLLPLALPTFVVLTMNYTGLYALVVLGIVLLTGVTGLTSFGQAAFVGMGAYTSAAISLFFGLGPLAGLAASMVIVCASALLLGVVTLRLTGHYLALSTLAWGIGLHQIMGNVQQLGGHTGLTGVPPLRPGYGQDSITYYYVVWCALGVCMAMCYGLYHSRPGRALRLINGSEAAASSVGVEPFKEKLAAFVIASAFAALSGWLYAHMVGFINPTPFSLQFGIEYLFMAVVGGIGSIGGALIGALAITGMKQLLQNALPSLSPSIAHLDQVVFGGLMIVMLHRAPGGIAPAIASALGVRSAPPHEPPEPALSAARRTMPAAGSPMLRVDRLSKAFGGVRAVNDVSFSVCAGTIVALIGPNGAGKSTTFGLVSGHSQPDSGQVRLGDVEITRLRPYEVARSGLARTFQHPVFKAEMSALENVAVGCHMQGRAGPLRSMLRMNRAEESRIRAVAMQQLARVGLRDVAHKPAGALPLGHQRTMEIARALCTDPQLLLLDEPAAGLRASEKDELAAVLRQLRREGLTVMVVEHDMQFLMRLADAVIVMNFGEKIAEGTPAEVTRNPLVVDAYLGVDA